MSRIEAKEWTRELFTRHLPGVPDAYNGFMDFIQESCPEKARVVDLGCGEEGYLTFLLNKASEITGVDGRELRGPYQSYLQADLNSEIPLPDESMDLATSKFLLEHLSNPQLFLSKVHKILRPHGRLVLMTPNILYYPYAVNYLLSRVLTQERRMHLVQLFTGRSTTDIFPVFYRCNTPGRIQAELERTGFDILQLRTYSDYLVSAVNRPLGALAVAYEKIVKSLGMTGVSGFIVVLARKK